MFIECRRSQFATQCTRSASQQGAVNFPTTSTEKRNRSRGAWTESPVCNTFINLQTAGEKEEKEVPLKPTCADVKSLMSNITCKTRRCSTSMSFLRNHHIGTLCIIYSTVQKSCVPLTARPPGFLRVFQFYFEYWLLLSEECFLSVFVFYAT